MIKRKGTVKDKQWSTNHYTENLKLNNKIPPLEMGGELRGSERVKRSLLR